MCRIRENSSDRIRRSQRSLDAVKLAIGMTPVVSSILGTNSLSSFASSSPRTSFQIMAGRMGLSCLSSTTKLCICPESPRALARTNSLGTAIRSWPIAARTALIQSCGSLSLIPRTASSTSYVNVAVASARWAESTKIAFVAVVPTSIPRYMVTFPGVGGNAFERLTQDRVGVRVEGQLGSRVAKISDFLPRLDRTQNSRRQVGVCVGKIAVLAMAAEASREKSAPLKKKYRGLQLVDSESSAVWRPVNIFCWPHGTKVCPSLDKA